MMWLTYIAAYMLGSIPFGKLFCCIGGVDIQKRGSGNIGFANVQRTMGWRYSIPTLVCDIAKGALATYLGLVVGGSVGAALIAGYCALIGHVFPPWLRFRGGKGIATGLGIISIISPLSALCAGASFVALRCVKVTASNASLVGSGIALTGLVLQYPTYWWAGLILGATTLFTLRQNIRGTVPNYG